MSQVPDDDDPSNKYMRQRVCMTTFNICWQKHQFWTYFRMSVVQFIQHHIDHLSNSSWSWETHIMSLSAVVVDVKTRKWRLFCTTIVIGGCICSKCACPFLFLFHSLEMPHNHFYWKAQRTPSREWNGPERIILLYLSLFPKNYNLKRTKQQNTIAAGQHSSSYAITSSLIITITLLVHE